MKVKVTLSIGLVGCCHEDVVEIDDDDVAGLSGDALENVLHEAWQEWAWQYIDGGATVIEEEAKPKRKDKKR